MRSPARPAPREPATRTLMSPVEWERTFRTRFAAELLDRYAPARQAEHRRRQRRAQRRWERAIARKRSAKRALDLVGASIGLLVGLPVLALAALLIKLEDGGPVLYRQRRVGQGGREFMLFKLRSMVTDAERELARLRGRNGMDGVLFKMRCDPRTTRCGRWLRRSSIDELPQLWNVLRGEMSLVGPRPPLPSEVERYTLLERTRLEVKPGLTCFWQIMGRSEIHFARQVQLDLDYIHRQSLSLDLWILARTIPAVFSGRGAY